MTPSVAGTQYRQLEWRRAYVSTFCLILHFYYSIVYLLISFISLWLYSTHFAAEWRILNKIYYNIIVYNNIHKCVMRIRTRTAYRCKYIHTHMCICVHAVVKCERLFSLENKTEDDDGQSIYGQSAVCAWQVGRFARVRRSFTYTAARCDNRRRTNTSRERGLIWLHTQVRVSIFLHYFHTARYYTHRRFRLVRTDPVKFPFVVFPM